MSKPMQLMHLSREIKTALELAIAGLAPVDLIDRLAVASGLLDAFTSLGIDHTSELPLVPRTLQRANHALGVWHQWQRENPRKASA